MTAGRTLRSGTSFRSSFRSRPQTCQSGDGNESQQGVDDVDVCRVDCWNGGYMEAKGQAAVLRDQQDWMAHNKDVVHGLQVRSAAFAYSPLIDCPIYCLCSNMAMNADLHDPGFQPCE